MAKKALLLAALLVLAWGLWVSPQFKEIAAGVAIFIFGMMAMQEGFKAFTGGVLEKVLRVSTDRTWKSLSFGFVTTTLMQSSSLVSVITISFLSAGLIGLAAGIGIIFGSNIGTTTGAWLVAGIGLNINISAYAMPLIVFGVVLNFQSAKVLKGAGFILAGIGFLFLGIHFMKVGFETFQESLDLTQFAVPGFTGVLIYTAVGIAATVVMQSSHATLILAIAALAAGQITYENSLAIAIGSNVGSTVTALLGALGANAAGKRLAGAHLIFNLTTGVLAVVLLSYVAVAVDAISGAIGIAADNFTLKFAVFHTLFNVAGVALMLPLIPLLVRHLERLIPEQVLDVAQPRYLNEAVLDFPDTALKSVFAEVGHLFDNAADFIAKGLGVSYDELHADRDLGELLRQDRPRAEIDFNDLYQRRIKGLHGAIVEFSSKAEAQMLPEQVEALNAAKMVARDIVQAVKDVKHLEKNVARYARSENAEIRIQYATIRRRIAEVLRAVSHVVEDRAASLKKLDELSQEIDAEDIVEDGTLDGLIRDNKITRDMGTSLINDNGYAQNIARRLIHGAQTVLGEGVYELLLEAEADLGEAGEEDLSGSEARAASAA
ncbi:MAG: Na/Pi symporter [Kiloniellales bacterium]|nr:Na/Pi symporter [Kiloniellales bacterium]